MAVVEEANVYHSFRNMFNRLGQDSQQIRSSSETMIPKDEVDMISGF